MSLFRVKHGFTFSSGKQIYQPGRTISLSEDKIIGQEYKFERVSPIKVHCPCGKLIHTYQAKPAYIYCPVCQARKLHAGWVMRSGDPIPVDDNKYDLCVEYEDDMYEDKVITNKTNTMHYTERVRLPEKEYAYNDNADFKDSSVVEFDDFIIITNKKNVDSFKIPEQDKAKILTVEEYNIKNGIISDSLDDSNENTSIKDTSTKTKGKRGRPKKLKQEDK